MNRWITCFSQSGFYLPDKKGAITCQFQVRKAGRKYRSRFVYFTESARQTGRSWPLDMNLATLDVRLAVIAKFPELAVPV